ncbi:MAG: hypothetical protein CMG74_10680 [Candidatus Marinimicrobia bacterium]|nr:hypothetical protein [Candidatus Neomarinimicrobiota bacterium]|tara:strand:+ start:8293 stop:9231 length:939 start_codon:yes stop_codon:yes gene_type:complete
MKKIIALVFSGLMISSSAIADLDCSSDSSYHIDNRTMLPDGSPNPTYGQEVATGLCACIGFVNGTQIDGNEVTFTLRIVDHEPIRGIELDIYHDAAELTFSGYAKGSKLENVTDDSGTVRQMTLLTNYLDDHLKVLAYSTARARTEGNGEEGDLCHITYTIADGATLPEQVEFYFGVANVPGTSMDPELLNVVCNYPDQNNPAIVSTAVVSADSERIIPEKFVLNQNFPNPFNPSTQISFDVPAGSEFISLNVYNLLGKNVITLVNKMLSPGQYTVEWDAVDSNGSPVASGIYFYELRSESFISRKKMLLIR